jgi:two-component system sensor histidine kinase/response regulator
MQMPEMGGAEAIGAVRAREAADGGHVPIISVTAHALKGDRERCLAAGADGYVSKPIAPAALFREIENVLLHRQTTAGTVMLPDAVTSGLLARVGGNQKVLEEVIALFLEDCPALITAIRQALAAGDSGAVYRSAHMLKGTVGNFDADKAMGIAQRLEARAREGDLDACGLVFAALELEVATLLASLTGTAGGLRCAS